MMSTRVSILWPDQWGATLTPRPSTECESVGTLFRPEYAMSDTAQPLAITHDAANQVFTAVVDGHTCEVEYRLEGDAMTITHTGVPSPVGGRGIAAALTLFAVRFAEGRHWKIVPACSYADTWFKRHPEYAHLLRG
jgi:predicted GNAT family acetyltransferase